jgi:hypothetical protein
MRNAEPDSHSFIVKIWLEETPQEAGRATWRGSITHVFSKERRYLRDLNEIARFIGPYLQEMGVTSSWRERLRSWLP